MFSNWEGRKVVHKSSRSHFLRMWSIRNHLDRIAFILDRLLSSRVRVKNMSLPFLTPFESGGKRKNVIEKIWKWNKHAHQQCCRPTSSSSSSLRPQNVATLLLGFLRATPDDLLHDHPKWIVKPGDFITSTTRTLRATVSLCECVSLVQVSGSLRFRQRQGGTGQFAWQNLTNCHDWLVRQTWARVLSNKRCCIVSGLCSNSHGIQAIHDEMG